ncbi:hypothetical protein BVAD3_39880 (plasmid) [Bacillus velezensis]|nr:hypothetical protein BVAD3_39880 [Bacillus velezensis]
MEHPILTTTGLVIGIIYIGYLSHRRGYKRGYRQGMKDYPKDTENRLKRM